MKFVILLLCSVLVLQTMSSGCDIVVMTIFLHKLTHKNFNKKKMSEKLLVDILLRCLKSLRNETKLTFSTI